MRIPIGIFHTRAKFSTSPSEDLNNHNFQTATELNGGVMLFVPLHLNPKERKDLNFF